MFLEENGDVAITAIGKETVESGVRGYFMKNLEGGCASVSRGFGVGWIVDVFMVGAVNCCCHGERFHCYFFVG